MKYIKPHLSPELRAQINPSNKRDKRFVKAGVFFLGLSAILVFNLVSRNTTSNNKPQLATKQTITAEIEKQVLGVATKQKPAAEVPKQEPAEQFTLYTVKQGDTLFNISQQYNIKWDLIAQINNLTEPYLLKIGQQLKIPQATTSKVPNKIYTIQKGDTLASIARAYNVTVSDIVAVNPNLQKSDLITPGQIIKLP